MIITGFIGLIFTYKIYYIFLYVIFSIIGLFLFALSTSILEDDSKN